ncbi:NADH:ubiquinone oxidoreductase subunit NDUFA12 [Sphingomonas montanisoli]|uniref:NADH:ubiquinone oxidoreductase subunit NDUFA12 n=1 Tax=Sphingomonas montanisoli TaxID=2606412 RepID=A0A5D9C4V8_9SPHN|nr:NADH:ubiquinone oxidoreductase subunit NDUFA12 [Sphingomonas montanisoli]TZG26242.1 NADH:ubiquinone oxidoreductase subunit NDUFA12 [Sphingomonas montanisoli]
MGLLKSIFTWWDGATIGTRLFSSRNGTRVGEDALGNLYFEGGTTTDGRKRRWVIYNGPNDASRVPAEWHTWLHHTTDITPDKLPAPRTWQKQPLPNLTGTEAAYLPSGALERGGVRAAATGDYEAWTPN